MDYSSTITKTSKVVDGVSFEVVRMSFGRRIELTRRVRELGRKAEFLESGGSSDERLEAAVLFHRIEALYLDWGLKSISGFDIDGEPATPARLIEIGPEELCREILAEIKAECGLSEEERKN